MSEVLKATSSVPAASDATKWTPEEIFQRIEEVRKSFDPEPTLFEQIISPGARAQAAAIRQAMVSAVHARRDVIEGLRRCIKTFIDAHHGDLKVRGAAFVTETLVTQFNSLHRVMEDSHVHLFHVYSEQCEKYDGIPNLSEGDKARLKDEARSRAWGTMKSNEERFSRILDDIREQVSRAVVEIGS